MTPNQKVVSALAAKNLSIPEICRATGLKESAVRYVGYRLGLTFRQHLPSLPPAREKVVAMDRRTVVVRSVPTGSSAVSESRIVLPRMPWEDPEGVVSARPETDPRFSLVKIVPEPMSRAERVIEVIRAELEGGQP